MRGGRSRAARVGAAWAAVLACVLPAAAQHEHHAAPADGAESVLVGTVSCTEGPALGGAVVQLFHEPGRHLVAAGVADRAGRFTVRGGPGRYTLEISDPVLGSHRQQVTLAGPSTSAGNLRLRCGAVGLDTLEVGARRDVVQLRSGSTVVDVRGSPAGTGSIADLLRTVPGLEVGLDGRIAMRGSTGVLVLVDGRPTPLTGDALVSFLRQMPASSLERVEAGTAASALHGVEGAAGVVNLVFRDAAGRTAMRSLAASMATEDHYMGSAAASGSLGGLVAWDATVSLSAMRPRSDSRTERWSVVPGDLPLRTDADSRGRATHRLHAVRAGAVVTPTANTSLALDGAYSWMEGAYRTRTDFQYTNAAGDTGTSATASESEHAIPSGEVGVAASVDRGTVHLTVEGRTSFVDEDVRGGYDDEVAGYRYMTAVMDSRQREHVLRGGVGLRFPGLEIDAGQESRFRTMTAAHDETHFGATLSRAYRATTTVHSGYLSARGLGPGLRAEAALRVEAERSSIELDGESDRRAVRLFPSLAGEWADPRRAIVYRLAYARRITRPGPEMLNPFSMGEDDMSEVVGNPRLLPEISDQLELGVERHGSWWMMQLTPFVRWTRDPIRPLTTPTERGATATTLANLDGTRAAGAEASVRARQTDRAVVTLAGSVAHVRTTADRLSRSGVYATARLTADIRLTGRTGAQFYAYRRSAQVIEQGEILPAFTTEVALTQRLAGDRGRVTMRLSDPLRGDQVEFHVADADFTQETRRRSPRPLLSLFASYAVGGAPREDAPSRAGEDPRRIF